MVHFTTPCIQRSPHVIYFCHVAHTLRVLLFLPFFLLLVHVQVANLLGLASCTCCGFLSPAPPGWMGSWIKVGKLEECTQSPRFVLSNPRAKFREKKKSAGSSYFDKLFAFCII